MKSFEKPRYEFVSFNNNIITASGCGCFDDMFCPTNYTNCRSDGAGCECEVNHSPALGNCTPCNNFSE